VKIVFSYNNQMSFPGIRENQLLKNLFNQRDIFIFGGIEFLPYGSFQVSNIRD